MIKFIPWLPHFWGWQMTQPLLFDDCLSILQKILLLAKKLNEVIEDLNKFHEDFNTWKAQVDAIIENILAALNELSDRVTALEQCCEAVQADLADLRQRIEEIEDYGDLIEQLQQDVTNLSETVNSLSTSITNITGDLTALTTRVTNAETAITNLQTAVTNLQTDLTALTNRVTAAETAITNLQNDVSALTTRMTAAETAITNIQNALARLDIQLPTQLIDETNFDQFADNWYAWISAFCDTAAGHATGTFASKLTRTLKIVPGVTSPIPARSLTIGKLGQNIVLCKLPLLLIATLTQPTTKANEAAVLAEVLQLVQDSGLDQLFINGVTSANPYFSGTGLEPYPYVIDDCKFQTSYMLFMYGAAAGTDIDNLYKIDFHAPSGQQISHATCINMDVRIVLTQNSSNIQMQVVSNELYFSIYNGEVVFYFIAENA